MVGQGFKKTIDNSLPIFSETSKAVLKKTSCGNCKKHDYVFRCDQDSPFVCFYCILTRCSYEYDGVTEIPCTNCVAYGFIPVEDNGILYPGNGKGLCANCCTDDNVIIKKHPIYGGLKYIVNRYFENKPDLPYLLNQKFNW